MSNRTKLPDGTRKSSTRPRRLPAWARKEVEDAIERLLAVLDAAESDADLEPELGSPNPLFLYEGGPSTSQERWAEGRNNSEDEHNGCEPPEDDEPALGWTACGAGMFSGAFDEAEPSLGSLDRRIDQTGWAAGKTEDREHEHDGREPDEDYEEEHDREEVKASGCGKALYRFP